MEPTYDLFVDHWEGHTILNCSILDELAAAGRQRFEDAHLPPSFSEFWNGRPQHTSLRMIRRQKTEPNLYSNTGPEQDSTTIKKQLDQSQQEKERLSSANKCLENEIMSLKEMIVVRNFAPAEAEEMTLEEALEELRKTKALVRVNNLQLENLKGKALLVAGLEEELQVERDEHAKTKEGLELAHTGSQELSEEHICSISQEGTIVNRSTCTDSSSSAEDDANVELKLQIAELQEQLKASQEQLKVSQEQLKLSEEQLSVAKSGEASVSKAKKEVASLQWRTESLTATHKAELKSLREACREETEHLRNAHYQEMELTKAAFAKEATDRLVQQENLMKDLEMCQENLVSAQKEMQKLASLSQDHARLQKMEEDLSQTKKLLTISEVRVGVLEGMVARGVTSAVPSPPKPAPVQVVQDPHLAARAEQAEERREQLESARGQLRTLISQISTCVNSCGSLELDLRCEMKAMHP